MSASAIRKRELLVSYVANNLPRLFPGYRMSEEEKLIPGNRTVDLHLKDQEGNDFFIEIKASKITESQIGELIDYYSAILNLEPQLKGLKLVVIGEGIEERPRKQMARLGISFKSFRELGIPIQRLLGDERRRRLRELTPTEARLVAKWEGDKISTVNVDSICGELACKRNYARTLLHRLERKKWLERVSKGIYTFIPAGYGYEERFPVMEPLLVGSKLVEPYYFSYATANSYYGFTTQIPSTHFIATTKKKPLFIWRNIAFQFVTLSNRKFFGFKDVDVDGVNVKMAEREKVIVDSLDKIRYAGGIEEIVRIICLGFNKIQREKLVNYAVKMGSHALCQRLGFILDFLESKRLIELSVEIRKALRANVGNTPIYLAPSRSRKGTFSHEWKIIKNLTDRELMSEIEPT